MGLGKLPGSAQRGNAVLFRSQAAVGRSRVCKVAVKGTGLPLPGANALNWSALGDMYGHWVFAGGRLIDSFVLWCWCG